jgi:hypothetical protein
MVAVMSYQQKAKDLLADHGVGASLRRVWMSNGECHVLIECGTGGKTGRPGDCLTMTVRGGPAMACGLGPFSTHGLLGFSADGPFTYGSGDEVQAGLAIGKGDYADLIVAYESIVAAVHSLPDPANVRDIGFVLASANRVTNAVDAWKASAVRAVECR